MHRFVPALMFCETVVFIHLFEDVSWFNAIPSQTFDATGSSDTGRLLFAISWSPVLALPLMFSRQLEKQMTTRSGLLSV